MPRPLDARQIADFRIDAPPRLRHARDFADHRFAVDIFQLDSELGDAGSYLLAREPSFRTFAVQSMTGTSGRQRVQSNALAHYKVVLPSSETASRFGEIVNLLFASIRAPDEQSRTLAAIRDTLLPRLLSGELRAPTDLLNEEPASMPTPPEPVLVQSSF